MKPIDPSKYRRPLTIQQPVGAYTSWSDVFGHVVMAQVKPQGGNPEHPELLNHLVAFRYRLAPQVNANMRILDGSHTYAIRTVVDVEDRHIEWQIKAVELLLNLTCVIQRNNFTRTPGGGATSTWQNVTQSNGSAVVPCLLTAPQGPILQVLAERLSDLSSAQIQVPLGTNIKQEDQITQIKLNGVEIVSGFKLQVQHIIDVQNFPLATGGLVSVLR